MRKIIYLLLTVWLLFVGFIGGWVARHKTAYGDDLNLEHEDMRELSDDDIDASRHNAIVTTVRELTPAVVSISVTQVEIYAGHSFGNPLLEYYFPQLRPRYKRYVKNLGSGFIINEDGYIVTNYHVVERATEIIVNLSDGRQFEAEFIGADGLSDIAILKIDAEEALPAVKLGDSDKIIIGEWAIAVGNPFGYVMDSPEPTVTVGVISALHRDFKLQHTESYQDMIQTDAAINPGNSGGPLAIANGEVVGVNAFIMSKSGGSEGLGFAIPINRLKRVANDLIKYGEIRRPYTGFSAQELNHLIAAYLGINRTTGLIITEIDDDSPAEKVGLQVGDILTAAGPEELISDKDLAAVLLDKEAGDELELTIFRIKEKKEFKVTLQLGQAY